MYKVILEFQPLNIIAINADDPNVAAQNIRKLFESGRAKPLIKLIKVFNEEDDIFEDQPLHTAEVFYESE
jgi:hypothetical protein